MILFDSVIIICNNYSSNDMILFDSVIIICNNYSSNDMIWFDSVTIILVTRYDFVWFSNHNL